jgi:hypothetical protein
LYHIRNEFFFVHHISSVVTKLLFFQTFSPLCSCYSYIFFLLSIFADLLLSYCFPFNLQVNALLLHIFILIIRWLYVFLFR